MDIPTNKRYSKDGVYDAQVFLSQGPEKLIEETELYLDHLNPENSYNWHQRIQSAKIAIGLTAFIGIGFWAVSKNDQTIFNYIGDGMRGLHP